MTTNQEVNDISELLKSQAGLLVKAGTGEISIRDSDFDTIYQDNDRKLVRYAKKFGLTEAFPWRTLWEWYGFYSRNLPDYPSRRTHIGTLLREAQDELDGLIDPPAVVISSIGASKGVVQAALADAEVLIREGRYTTVVDRLHTAIHGHLRWICENYGISITESDPSATRLMRLIREQHPKFAKTATLDEDMKRIFMGMGNILESLNSVRNNASPAHPIDKLLDEPEARLAVNVAQTILTYVDDKTQAEPIELLDA